MTLLSGESTLVVDGAAATQALLVRTYLQRVRRRPAVPRAAGHPAPEPPGPDDTVHLFPPAGTGVPGSGPRPSLAAALPRPPMAGSLLVRLTRPAAVEPPPAAVRTAVAFLEARAAEPIGLAEVADAAGLSPRALQAAFQRHLGTTPLGHLRAVRMARIHADLQAARPGDGTTVSTVANRWGISQLSRFAREYRRRYGVTPRDTLVGSPS